MTTPKEIAKIWKRLTHYKNYNERAEVLCQLLSLKFEKLPRKLYKIKSGDTDGYLIRCRNIVDKFDMHTLFHEIGHTQLHFNKYHNPIYEKKMYDLNKSIIEKQANDYADNVMIELFGDSCKLQNILKIAKL